MLKIYSWTIRDLTLCCYTNCKPSISNLIAERNNKGLMLWITVLWEINRETPQLEIVYEWNSTMEKLAFGVSRSHSMLVKTLYSIWKRRGVSLFTTAQRTLRFPISGHVFFYPYYVNKLMLAPFLFTTFGLNEFSGQVITTSSIVVLISSWLGGGKFMPLLLLMGFVAFSSQYPLQIRFGRKILQALRSV